MPAVRKIDYFAFTLKECIDVHEVMTSLGLKFIQLAKGHHGYNSGAVAESGGVMLYWDGSTEGMGVHVQISGGGCRLVEAMEGFPSWQEYIGGWLKNGAKATRLDIAIDDDEATVDFDTIKDAVLNRTCMMRSKRHRLILDCDGTTTYPTLYVGRRSSETMMRCYDKGLQLKQGRSWLRFEFEYKGARADAVARLLADSGWDAAVGVARSFIEFKDETHQTSDRTRQRAAAWWAELINASKHVLHLSREAHTSIVRTFTWVLRQVAPSLAVLLEYCQGDLSIVMELYDHGKAHWKDKHRLMLKHALGGPDLLGGTA